LPEIDLRWRNKAIGIEQHNDHAALTIRYAGRTVPAARRICRRLRWRAVGAARHGGADFAGEVFEDQFLIADVKVTEEFPAERKFWFDPLFHAGQSALCAPAAGR